MFFELAEIQRIDSQLNQIENNKNQLTDILSKSYGAQNTVRGSMGQTIQDIISKAKHSLDTITIIEQQAENGYLIPEQFDIEELVYEKGQLPQWFEFVFKKEFSKQKKTFDVTAKKMYKMNGLRQKKQELALEIKSFQTLYGRYQSLSENQQNCLNIMAEAETLKNKTRFVTEKFTNYVHLVTSKIVAFLQENIARSLNYSNQIQTFSHYNSIPDVSHQTPQIHLPSPPKPPPCLIDGGQSFYQIRKPLRRQAYQTTGFTDYGKSLSPKHFCRNHSQHTMKHFGQGKYNYRDYMGKWMGKTLGDYYI